MLAKITLLGLNSYYKQMHPDKSLFELLTLPESVDRDACINHILLRCGEFCVLYPNPDFMHDAIKVFSDTYARTISKWSEALNIEYHPLENYDRLEDWTDTGSAFNNMFSKTNDDIDNIQTITQKVSPFEVDTFQNSKEDTAIVDNTSEASTGGYTSSETSNTRTGRTHGNIGVTTSQQMLEAEIKIAKWNLYDNIAILFQNEFCIMLY